VESVSELLGKNSQCRNASLTEKFYGKCHRGGTDHGKRRI
jgi:hypothetical protein